MKNLLQTILDDTKEMLDMVEDIHKPFSGMIEEGRKLEVECKCG
jgi:hypothetical protein